MYYCRRGKIFSLFIYVPWICNFWNWVSFFFFFQIFLFISKANQSYPLFERIKDWRKKILINHHRSSINLGSSTPRSISQQPLWESEDRDTRWFSSINLGESQREGDDREERKEGWVGSSSSSVLFIRDRKVVWIGSNIAKLSLHYSWSWSSYDFFSSSPFLVIEGRGWADWINRHRLTAALLLRGESGVHDLDAGLATFLTRSSSFKYQFGLFMVVIRAMVENHNRNL